MIHRLRKTANFAQISNTALRDERLSYCARGILAMVMSHSEEWKTSTNWIRESTPTEGAVAIANALAQLKECGYLVIRRVKSKNGKVTGCEWLWSDRPQEPEPESDEPHDGIRYDGNPDTQNTIGTEHNGEEEAETSSPPPQADSQLPRSSPIPTPPPKVPRTPRPPRPRNPLFDAMAQACYGPTPLTKGQGGWISDALQQIKEVQPDLAPEMIVEFAKRRRKEWPEGPVNPGTYIKHWKVVSPETETVESVIAKAKACRGYPQHVANCHATEEEKAEYKQLVALYKQLKAKQP